MKTEWKNFKITGISRPTKEDISKILKVKEESTILPNVEDATTLFKEIWGTKFSHKQNAEWIDKGKEQMSSEK